MTRASLLPLARRGALLAAAIVAALRLTTLADNCRDASRDLLVALARPGAEAAGRPDGFLLVAVDDESLARLAGGGARIPRETYAELLDALAPLAPAVVALDMLFAPGGETTGEARFAAAAARFPAPLVLPGSPADGSFPGTVRGYVRLFRGLPGAPDAVRRRFVPVTREEGTLEASLPVAVAAARLGARPVEEPGRIALRRPGATGGPPLATVPVDADGAALLPHLRPLRAFDTIPLADLLDAARRGSAALPGLVGGRIVIVGSTAPRHRDIHAVPSGRLSLPPKAGREFGAVLVADATAAILRGEIPAPLPPAADALLAFLAAAPIAPVALAGSHRANALALAAAAPALLYAAHRLHAAGKSADIAGALLALCLTVAAGRALHLRETRRRAARLAATLFKFVSPEVARLISSEEYGRAAAGGKRPVTVLFADIRGFTPLSERMDPEALTALLNDYFNRMVGIIFAHGGTVDKFIGDAIMVLFGAPVAQPDAAARAARCALAMRAGLDELKAEWRERGCETIDIGIGINSGVAFVGEVGADIHKEYTALGDDVNLAARLESAAAKGQILLSAQAAEGAAGAAELRELPPRMLKGKSAPVRIFELLGPARAPAHGPPPDPAPADART